MASISKRMVAGKPRYDVNYREPDGRARRKTFTRKADADTFANAVETDKMRGLYIDPDAGRITFKKFAEGWIAEQYDATQAGTREAVELRFRLHVYPVLGSKMLGQIKVASVLSWVAGLKRSVQSEAYRKVIFANVSAIFASAVETERIAKNPCKSEAVRKLLTSGNAGPRKVVPWSLERVAAVRLTLPEQYRIALELGAGLGLRQGEVFGLSPDDVDFLRGTVEVQRQVKVLSGNKQVFGLPKGNKTRTVPLAPSLRDLLAAHLASRPARPVALPWRELDAPTTTVRLVISTREAGAMNRNYFNTHIWKPALVAAEVAPIRENGTHALRHHFASVLLDAGESIKAVSEWLGHADPGFTLRTYTHLMPTSAERAQKAIDGAFACYISGTSSLEMGVQQA